MENNKPYFSNFRLYGEKNLQVSFNVFSDSLDEHLANLDEATNRLFGKGYTVDPKGKAEGSRIQDIAGWVLGETSNGQPCVYLYAGHPKMIYPVHTIWEEEIPKLPISIPNSMNPQLGAPPKDKAEKAGILNKCDFKIVLVPKMDFNGNIQKTDHGNIVYKFDSVYGESGRTTSQEKPTERQGKLTDNNSNGNDSKNSLPSDDPYYELSEGLSQNALKMLRWGRGVQSDNKKFRKTVKTESLEELVTLLDIELGYETAGMMVLAVLTGKDAYTIEEVKEYTVKSLLEWLPEKIDGELNDKYKSDYLDSIRVVWSATRKFMLSPDLNNEQEVDFREP